MACISPNALRVRPSLITIAISLGAKQQAVIYKYENKEFPHAADAKVVMYADETCGDSNAAVGVKFRYFPFLPSPSRSVSLQDCKVNATDYTSCSTGKDVKGTFTMISNTAAASMSVSCEPPLADGESIDILTTTTQCMIAGMMDLIALLKEAGSEMIKGNTIDLKRVGMLFFPFFHLLGDQLYMGDDLAFDLVDNTGCLAPTNDLLTLPANCMQSWVLGDL